MIVSDATHLPPPYRIENRSPVALYYQQSLATTDLATTSSAPDIRPGNVVLSQGGANGRILMNRLPPRSIINYAPEEPLLPPRLSVGVAVSLWGILSTN